MRKPCVLAVLMMTACTFLLGACDMAESTRSVEYIADGTTRESNVAFVAPEGVPAADDSLFWFWGDTTFVRADTTLIVDGRDTTRVFVDGDTTYVLNAALPVKVFFDAEEGADLYLRTENLTERGHVSAIILRDGQFYTSDGADTLGIAVARGVL